MSEDETRVSFNGGPDVSWSTFEKATDLITGPQLDPKLEVRREYQALDFGNSALYQEVGGLLRNLDNLTQTKSAALAEFQYKDGSFCLVPEEQDAIPLIFTASSLKQLCTLLGISTKSLQQFQDMAGLNVPLREDLSTPQVMEHVLLQQLKHLWSEHQLDKFLLYLYGGLVRYSLVAPRNIEYAKILDTLRSRYEDFSYWALREFRLEELSTMHLFFVHEGMWIDMLEALTGDTRKSWEKEGVLTSATENYLAGWYPALHVEFDPFKGLLTEEMGLWYKDTGIMALFCQTALSANYVKYPDILANSFGDFLDTWASWSPAKMAPAACLPVLRHVDAPLESSALWGKLSSAFCSALGKKNLTELRNITSVLSDVDGNEVILLDGERHLWELVDALSYLGLNLEFPKRMKLARTTGQLLASFLVT